jgi:D-alanyl-D-alanine carboxypeptidase
MTTTLPAVLRVVAIVLVSLLAVAAPASADVAASPSLRQLAKGLNTAGSPGAIVLVRDANGTKTGVAGYANLRTKERLRADHAFRVGSITKTFVATVALQLAAEGALGLDDTVEKWLPGLVPNGQAITLRHLLNHTSGIYNYTEDEGLFRSLVRNPLRVLAPADLIAVATRHAPLFDPGTSWSYSNTGYIVLGLVIEKATAVPLERQLRQRIFEPLGLTHTSFPAVASLPRPFARGYLPPGNGVLSTPGGKPVDVTAWSPSWAWAAGALVSTAGDLARFYQALLGGELLQPEQLREMRAAVQTPGGSSRYGLGLAEDRLQCGPALGHTGGVPGYTSFAYSSEDGSRQAVVLINTSPGSDRLASRLGSAFGGAFCR